MVRALEGTRERRGDRPRQLRHARLQGEKNSPLTRSFLQAIRAEGGDPAFVYYTGTADLHIVGSRWNCPAVGYGLGGSALDHTPEEHVSLDEFACSIRVLEHLLQTLTHAGFREDPPARIDRRAF